VRWASLLLTLQQALWVDVPFIQQGKDGCGSASIWMVIEYWKPGTAGSVDDIQRQLYSKTAGGIYARDIARYFEAHGYRAYAFQGEWVDLEQHVSKGRPLIVSLELNTRGVPLHYVVVAGVDAVQDIVLLNDPAQRKSMSMSRAEFEASWRVTQNWTLLALPEVDLATEAFREKRLPEAQDHLTAALRRDPADRYSNDFLATIHFLQDNTEAAIKYWNHASKPRIENIVIDPPLEIDPILLDRAFAFSRGSILRLRDFETTEARLQSLHVFSRFRIELSPKDDQSFDVTLRAAERSGTNMLGWLRGLPFQSVRPEFSNVRGRALNVRSLLRWDPNKRRAFAEVESPLRGDPKWGVRFTFDGRRESWASSSTEFQMRKVEGRVAMLSVPSGRWRWQTGAGISSRGFTTSLASGIAVKSFGSITRTLFRDPARRFTLDSSLSVESGKLFSASNERYGKVTTDVSLHWHELKSEVRWGRTLGQAPFDERFVVGVERDSEFWLRGHSATLDGRKRTLNAVRAFLITNSDIQKHIFDRGWFSLTAGPFVDTGKSAVSPAWLVDAGLETRFSILHTIGFTFSYGRSLRDGQHAMFFRDSR
jgi:predicted double-glycine peptidase